VISVGLVGALVAAAYAYDNSRHNLIADGVRVAGVDVGGLRENAARVRLQRKLTSRLDRSVRVLVAGRRFRLTPKTASLAVDVDAMVDEALDRSHSGGLPGRMWRGLTGSSVDADLPARVTYGSLAVRGFANRVKRAVDRPVRNASVRFKTASLPAVPSETGLTVNPRRLLRLVQGAIIQTGRGRRVRVNVKVTQPKVTTAELARKYPFVITINRPSFELRYFRRLRLAKTYRIAVGMAGLETPAGLYHIQDKQVNPSWHVPKSAWAESTGLPTSARSDRPPRTAVSEWRSPTSRSSTTRCR
jgi:hypothetical protein